MAAALCQKILPFAEVLSTKWAAANCFINEPSSMTKRIYLRPFFI